MSKTATTNHDYKPRALKVKAWRWTPGVYIPNVEENTLDEDFAPVRKFATLRLGNDTILVKDGDWVIEDAEHTYVMPDGLFHLLFEELTADGGE